MRKEVKLYKKGDCVEVSVLDIAEARYYQLIGIVLGSQIVEMDDHPRWLYTIVHEGIIDDFWDYEIRPVNAKAKPYNNTTHKAKQENEWQNNTKVTL